MSLTLTERAFYSIQKTKKEPAIVVEFDGIDQRFGSATILEIIRIGDPDLYIDGSWTIGGFASIDDQINAVAFDSNYGSTSTKIDYKLNPDKGLGSSVTSVSLALVDDKSNTILGLVSSYEFLARGCRIYIAPDGTDCSFPEDYIIIFRGIVDEVEAAPGVVVLNISHPDQKKRQNIFTKATTELTGNITNSQTSISVTSTADFLNPVLGPDGLNDTTLKFYARINDEVVRYDAASANTLFGVTRGQLGTTAASAAAGDTVDSFYRLTGDAMDLALKLMLSGVNDYYVDDIRVDSFEVISPTEIVENSILIEGVDLESRYGITVGDYITTVGASGSGNNVTLKTISDIVKIDDGTYIVIDGVTFSNEADPPSGCVLKIRSKYDTLGEGLAMSPDIVDVAEHERLNSLFLSGFDYDFYVKDTISNGKDFIEKEIYSPIACYSIPRKAMASIGYHIGPIPTQTILTLDESNIKNANRISKKRSTGKNFYNTIIYRYDDDVLEDRFLKGFATTDAGSRDQIPIGNKALTIDSGGLRTTSFASQSATRRLNRYKYAAEYFTGIKLNFEKGFNIDVGDIVILDGTNLYIPDFTSGSLGAGPKLYEVITKSIDLKSGDVSIELVDTAFSLVARYALISPASRIKTGISASSFIIESSFASVYGDNEYLKWSRFEDLIVRVHDVDFTQSATARVQGFAGNLVTLEDTLSFTPSSSHIMEMSDYADATEEIKLIYGFISGSSYIFPSDGASAYTML